VILVLDAFSNHVPFRHFKLDKKEANEKNMNALIETAKLACRTA
jgi:hypothetical protein